MKREAVLHAYFHMGVNRDRSSSGRTQPGERGATQLRS